MRQLLIMLAILGGLWSYHEIKTDYRANALNSTCLITSYTVRMVFNFPHPILEPAQYVGTGVIFAEDKENYFIVTAGHVAEVNPIVILTFANKKTTVGTVIYAQHNPFDINDHEDFGIIKLRKQYTGQQFKPIPFGSSYTNPVFTVGCAGGEHQSIVMTNIKNRCVNCGTFDVDFNPIPGRSGSGVFDTDGRHLLGIITRINGECVSSERIQEIMKKCVDEVDLSYRAAIIDIWSLWLAGQCCGYPFLNKDIQWNLINS